MNHSIRPEEHEFRQARNIVEGAIEACKACRKLGNDLKVSLGWTEDDFTVENLKGVHGFTYSGSHIDLNFNTEAEDWKEGLQIFTAHEYAHAIFFEENSIDSNEVQFNWQHFLMEAHSQHFSERVFPDKHPEWRQAVEKDELAEKWGEVKSKMSSELEEEQIIDNPSFDLWTGYSLAYLIGEKLLENHGLDEFPDLKRSDVLEAGDALFK